MPDVGTRIPLPSRTGLVRPTFRKGLSPRAANTSLRPAGADKAEADAAQAVTADPSIVDTERDPSYRHGVQQNWNGTPGRCEMYCAGLSDWEWLGVCDCFATDGLRKREEARQERLSRFQAQR